MILALDLATRTGWCKGDGSCRPLSGVIRLPSTGDDVGSFLLAWEEQLPRLLDGCKLAVFEAPILPRTTSFKTVTKLHSLAGLTELRCLRSQVRGVSVMNARVKKAATGKGNAKKPDMIAAVKGLGFAPQDDNEADAIAIWLYAVGARSQLEQHALVKSWGGADA